MARDLPPALAALIASRRAKQHVALDVLLNDGTPLQLSNAKKTVGTKLYQALLDEVEDLHLGLPGDDDSQAFKAANANMVLGRTVTGQTSMLDGATADIGAIFEDPATGAVYFDEKMPGDLLASEVSDKHLALDVVDEIYSTIVAGKPVYELFPFRPPPAPETRPNPDDLRPVPGLTPHDGFDPDINRRERYPLPHLGL